MVFHAVFLPSPLYRGIIIALFQLWIIDVLLTSTLNKPHSYSVSKPYPYFNLSKVTLSTPAVVLFFNIFTVLMTFFSLFFFLNSTTYRAHFSFVFQHNTIIFVPYPKISLQHFLEESIKKWLWRKKYQVFMEVRKWKKGSLFSPYNIDSVIDR